MAPQERQLKILGIELFLPLWRYIVGKGWDDDFLLNAANTHTGRWNKFDRTMTSGLKKKYDEMTGEQLDVYHEYCVVR